MKTLLAALGIALTVGCATRPKGGTAEDWKGDWIGRVQGKDRPGFSEVALSIEPYKERFWMVAMTMRDSETGERRFEVTLEEVSDSEMGTEEGGLVFVLVREQVGDRPRIHMKFGVLQEGKITREVVPNAIPVG